MSEELIARIETSAQAQHDAWIAGVMLANLGRNMASVAMFIAGAARRDRQIHARPNHTIDSNGTL